MNAVWPLLGVVAGLAGGGALAFLLGRWPRLANGVGAVVAVLGCALGLWLSVQALAGGEVGATISLPWRVPLADFLVGVDRLSAFFLVPVFGLGAVASAYGATYLLAWSGRKNLGGAWFAFNLLVAGMALLLLARNGVLFLLAWEIMSLSAWFLVAFDHEREEVQRAGWIYLVATHLGAAALFVLFLVLQNNTGSEDFTTAPTAGAPTALLLALALVGFGAKAGLVPLHVWLPEAHAAAPSHVSAMMSGVMVKMGIYGILRTVAVLGVPPVWLGPLLGMLGLLGGVLGIGLSLSQRDLKRALAYSSIENIGVILLGMGLGYWGVARGHLAVASLGFAGALLHVWNHTLMKGLMFLGAGSVLHGAGTKDIEQLGGLMRRMPRTGLAMAVGAVALAALPPLNGFVSEWLLYSGLVRVGTLTEGGAGFAALLAVGMLALVGALAAAAFARLIGVVFLGAPRSEAAAEAHESSPGLLVPMALLAAGCVGIALVPNRVLGLVLPVVSGLSGGAASELPDAGPMGAISLATLLAVGLVAGLLRWSVRSRPTQASETWGCGYAAPNARMQYTGRAFSQSVADAILPTALRPRVRAANLQGVLPRPTRLAVDYGDPAYQHGYLPFFRRWAIRFTRLRQYQQGKTWFYIAYIALAMAGALGWSSLRDWTP